MARPPGAAMPRERGLDALDQRAGAEATAAAHGHEAVTATGALELVEGLRGEDGAGAAERVAEADRAAVGVDLGVIGADLALPRDDDRCERLVDLRDVDVVDGQT